MDIISRYKNINGVTCYMNSILSILFQTNIFIKLLFDNNFYINQNYIKKNPNIIMELKNLFEISYNNKECTIKPLLFIAQINKINNIWSVTDQQDSHEFLVFLLDELHKNTIEQISYFYKYNSFLIKDSFLKNIFIKKVYTNYLYNDQLYFNYSNVLTPFTGFNKIKTECSYCKVHKYTIDKFIILSVQIPFTNKSIDCSDCLDNFYAKEKLLFCCDFCGNKCEHILSTYLYKEPEILIINFKRFDFTGKNTVHINYFENINLDNYIKYKTSLNYSLYATNIHIGPNQNYGHYVSFIKNIYNNKWYLHNDENVICIDYNTYKDSYLLFYQKI